MYRHGYSLFAVLMSAALVLPACAGNDDDTTDNDNDNDPPPSSWLVGEDGEMLRLADDDTVSTYPLQHSEDLNAIACLGEHTAWVAGDAGSLLLSRDTGQQWTPVETGVTEDLQSVGVSEGHAEGHETIWVAGYEGTVLRSVNGGEHWDTIESSSLDWTSIATTASGTQAWVAALDGGVWHTDGARLEPRYLGEGALFAVAVTHDGTTAVAVGEGGTIIRADDGLSFVELNSPTTEDLHAVQISSDGTTIVAVGDGGTVVRIEEGQQTTVDHAADGAALYGLHLRADGTGQAVGAEGTALRTEDGGRTWRSVTTGSSSDLRGVDDFHHGPHL